MPVRKIWKETQSSNNGTKMAGPNQLISSHFCEIDRRKGGVHGRIRVRANGARGTANILKWPICMKSTIAFAVRDIFILWRSAGTTRLIRMQLISWTYLKICLTLLLVMDNLNSVKHQIGDYHLNWCKYLSRNFWILNQIL